MGVERQYSSTGSCDAKGLGRGQQRSGAGEGARNRSGPEAAHEDNGRHTEECARQARTGRNKEKGSKESNWDRKEGQCSLHISPQIVGEALRQTMHVVMCKAAKACYKNISACKVPASHAKSKHDLQAHIERFGSTAEEGRCRAVPQVKRCSWMANHMEGTKAKQGQKGEIRTNEKKRKKLYKQINCTTIESFLNEIKPEIISMYLNKHWGKNKILDRQILGILSLTIVII